MSAGRVPIEETKNNIFHTIFFYVFLYVTNKVVLMCLIMNNDEHKWDYLYYKINSSSIYVCIRCLT